MNFMNEMVKVTILQRDSNLPITNFAHPINLR